MACWPLGLLYAALGGVAGFGLAASLALRLGQPKKGNAGAAAAGRALSDGDGSRPGPPRGDPS